MAQQARQITKRMRVPMITTPLFPEEQLQNGFWLDVIVDKSDSEASGGAKKWSEVVLGSSTAQYVPLMTVGSNYSFPYISGYTHDFGGIFARTIASTTLADADLPYVVLIGEI